MEISKEVQNKKRLGRGLGSLLGEAAGNELSNTQNNTETAGYQRAPLGALPGVGAEAGIENAVNQTENKIWQIAIDKIVPGIYQPRKNFDKIKLAELAASIKESGVLQPITVRKRKEGGFEIIAGERRWRAAQAAGLHEMPAIIKTLSDRESLQIALIENIQREDLDPIEEAESYQRLIEEFSLSQQEASEKVGKERSTIANALRLLVLPNEIKDLLTNRQLSVGHAKVLLGLTDQKAQVSLAKKTAELGLSVRALEAELKKSARASLSEKNLNEAGGLNIDMATKLANELADQLQKSLGTKVEINYRRGKGSVQVHFYSDDQLTQIYEKLKN